MSESGGPLARPEIASHLAATELFSLLEPQELADLAGLFAVVEHGAGQVIAEPDQVDGSLWVVISGGVSIGPAELRPAAALEVTRGYGTVIGQRGVFLGTARDTRVRTLMATTFLHADGVELWDWIRQRPQLVDRLVLPDEIRQGLALPPEAGAVRGEHTMALFRRHPADLLRALLLPVLVLGGLAAAAWFAAPFLSSRVAILALGLLVLGVPVLAAAWVFLDYYHDYLVVTDRRLIHVERTPLIDARRHEAPLATIQDIQILRPSLASRLLGYGDVVIQTASTRGELRLRRMASPERVRAVVFDLMAQSRDFDRQRYRLWVADQVRELLGGTPQSQVVSPDWLDDASEDVLALPGLEPAMGRWARVWGLAIAALSWPLPKLRCQNGPVVTWRKHWWVLFRQTFVALLAAVLLTGAMLYLLGSPWRGGPSPRERPRPVLAIGSLLLATLGLLAWRFEDWRNDVYQLTDEHVVDVERRPLGFFEHRRQAQLSQVQDIRFWVPNPWARLLNYGHVEIQTAAETGSFTFDYVHSPLNVQQEIFARIDEQRRRREERERLRRAEEVRTWLAEYHRLVNGPPSAPEPPAGPC